VAKDVRERPKMAESLPSLPFIGPRGRDNCVGGDSTAIARLPMRLCPPYLNMNSGQFCALALISAWRRVSRDIGWRGVALWLSAAWAHTACRVSLQLAAYTKTTTTLEQYQKTASVNIHDFDNLYIDIYLHKGQYTEARELPTVLLRAMCRQQLTSNVQGPSTALAPHV
jgi:hypothetical protein